MLNAGTRTSSSTAPATDPHSALLLSPSSSTLPLLCPYPTALGRSSINIKIFQRSTGHVLNALKDDKLFWFLDGGAEIASIWDGDILYSIPIAHTVFVVKILLFRTLWCASFLPGRGR